MSALRKNISIPETLYDAAQAQIPLHFCDGFSEYIATLIREDIKKYSDSKVFEPPGTYGGHQIEPPVTKRKRRA